VALVRIYLLLIEHPFTGQGSCQDHRLLDMHIIIGSSMDQQELTIPQIIHIFGEITLFVTLVVIRNVGETQIALGICRV